LYPFFFSPTLSSVEETLLELKEALRRIPQRGLGFGILRYLHPDIQIRQQLASLPHPEMSFNYLGQFDQPHTGASQFLPAQESVGYLHHPQGQRTHLLEMNSSIVQGKLQWSWTYSEHVHTRQNIRHLTEHCMGVLREICTICHKTTATRFTPSDFSLLNLDRNQLDRLINRVMEANEE
jgi:non-ribosomal peptide synthase protein (TIGR01720 family)